MRMGRSGHLAVLYLALGAAGACGGNSGTAVGGTGGSGSGGGGSGGKGGGTGTGGTVAGTGGSGGGSTMVVPPLPPDGMVTLGTPTNAGDWGGTPVATGNVPAIVYPSNQTRFPRNIWRTLFQWKAQGFTQFRLKLDGPVSKVTVYTDGKHAQCTKVGSACWEADEKAWGYIAGANAGQTVTWTVDGLDASTTPPTVRRSAPITIGFSKQDVEGAIFYWSTTSAGIRRANISAATPEDYMTGKPSTTYTNPNDQVKCVACHVVSRDGKYMVAPVDAMSGGGLWITEVTRAAPPTPLIKNVPQTKGHGFATISPDDANVVAAWGGKMWMLDRATGANKGDLPLGAVTGTHPDWSPDGSQVVFATGKDDSPAGASLMTIPWAGGKWGTPAMLLQGSGMMRMPKPMMGVPPPPGGSNLFPMHAPDGKWIAFSRGKGGHGDMTAQLWVIGAKGGTPVELVNANRVVSNAMGDGQTENNQPTWAPPGDYHWVAFNSQREYGVVLPKGTQQIWVAAIDPAKLGTAQDPSFPAFRLQFQGLDEDNHRAFWTLDVRDPPKTTPVQPPTPDGGVACYPANGPCDPASATRCCDGQRCDSANGGMTWTCTPRIIE